MSYSPMKIGGPFQTGLVTTLDDALLPPDGFADLSNFHINDGRVEKRSGYRFLGRMTHSPQTTITNITQANPAVVTVSSASGLSNGQFITINSVVGMVEVNNMRFKIANLSGTDFDLQDEDGVDIDSTGYTAYDVGGILALAPGNRIMGIHRYFSPDNVKNTLIFDTKRAAIWDDVENAFDPLDTADIFDSSDTDYVWAVNWQHSDSDNRLYFSNGKIYDGSSLNGIRYFSNPSGSTTTTTSFVPDLNVSASRKLYGAKLLFALKDRLVALHTYEYNSSGPTTTTHPQRARWCQAQGPSNWKDEVAGGGGFVDAPTGEHIISARQLGDAIIVFFTDSIWALSPISDPSLPFVWQKLDDNRSCNGKMATVGFNSNVAALGTRGVVSANGQQVVRIDEKIKKFTNDQINTEEFDKVFAFRDFRNERVIVLYPSGTNTDADSALVYDESSASFSTYSLGMNVLGFINDGEDYAYDDFTAARGLDLSYEDFDEETYESFFWQSEQENIVGGDTSGQIFVLQSTLANNESDFSATMESGDISPFNQEARSQFGFLDLYLETDESTSIRVEFFKDDDVSPVVTKQINCLPDLKEVGQIANITQANPAVVTLKNHGLSNGSEIYIYGAQGMRSVSGGPYTVTVVNENNVSIGVDSSGFSEYTTGGTVVKRLYYRTKVWKRIFAGGIGYSHRYKITTLSGSQEFILHAAKAWFKPVSRRTI